MVRWIFFISCVLVMVVLLVGSVMGSTDVGTAEPVAPPVAPWLQMEEQSCSCVDCPWLLCDDPEPEPYEPVVDRDTIIREAVTLWNLYYDDDSARADDPRRDYFGEIGGYLADAVHMYQESPTDIGGQLPGHRDDHLVVAYMWAEESSVTPGAVGTSHGEVGLGQVHGIALAGYDPDKVKNNPKLGALLSVRWIAYSLSQCKQEGGVYGDSFAWELSDWAGPLSAYAGGPKAIRKDGSCYRYEEIVKRINRIRMYRNRIDFEHRAEEM